MSRLNYLSMKENKLLLLFLFSFLFQSMSDKSDNTQFIQLNGNGCIRYPEMSRENNDHFHPDLQPIFQHQKQLHVNVIMTG